MIRVSQLRFRPSVLILVSITGWWVAGCRSQPAPENPFHAGEVRTSDVHRQRIPVAKTPTRMADAVLMAPSNCHGSFGEAVAVGGGLVVIGAPQAEGTGRVWVHDAEHLDAAPAVLQPPRGSERERFGASVAVSPSGRWIAVGAPHAGSEGAKHAGCVYVWRRDGAGWKFERAFTDPDADAAGERLGSTVAIDDESLIAGAPLATMRLSETGIVDDHRRAAPPRPGEPEKPPPSGEPRSVERVTHVFPREGAVLAWMRKPDGSWSDPTVSLLTRGREGATFGASLSLLDGQLVVGAPSQRTKYGGEGGTVSIFARRAGSPWRRDATAIISPSTAETLDLFGTSVASAPGLAVVGIPNGNLRLAPDAGRVAIFRQNVETRLWLEESWSQDGWGIEPMMQSPDPETGSLFGQAVAISGRQVIVGQPNTSRGAHSGRVFVFEKRDPPAGETKSTWQAAEEWVAPEFARVQRFGAAMNATPDLVAIAAPGSERVPGCVMIYRPGRKPVEATPQPAPGGVESKPAEPPAAPPVEPAPPPAEPTPSTPPPAVPPAEPSPATPPAAEPASPPQEPPPSAPPPAPGSNS